VKRALLLAALVGAAAAIGCDGDPSTPREGSGNPQDTLPAAAVEVVHAVRGRQDTAAWWITPSMRNTGGSGTFYIKVEGEAVGIDGPRAQCGLTGNIDVPALWEAKMDFVFECERAPQYLTVYTRAQGETDFRITDEWVY